MTSGATHTPREIAEWMVEELGRVRFLYQETAAYQIVQRFGREFTYDNSNGNLAINKQVLREFRRLTGDRVIWERSERMWRQRATLDRPGRQQE